MKMNTPVFHVFFAVLLCAAACRNVSSSGHSQEAVALLQKARDISNDPENSIVLTEQALNMALEKNDRSCAGDCYNWLGLLYQRVNRPLMAEECLKKALQLRRSKGLDKSVADVYNNFANLRRSQINTKEALAYTDSAMTIYKNLRDSTGLIKVYLSMAEILRNIDTDTAHACNLRALHLLGARTSPQQRIQVWHSLAQSYHFLSYKDTAHVDVPLKSVFYYQHKALRLSDSIQDVEGMAGSMEALSTLYWEKDQLDSFNLLQQQAERLYKSLKDSLHLYILYYNRGLTEQDNNIKQALSCFQQARNYLASQENPAEWRDLYEQIAFTWEKAGRPDSVVHYYKEAALKEKQLRQRMNVNHQKAMLAQMGHYERGLELQQSRRSNLILILSVAVLVLLLTSILFFLRALQRKKHHEDLLHQQKINDLILHQETENMLSATAGETRAREATAQHLHDGVGSILIALQWELESLTKAHPDSEAAARALDTTKLAYQEVKKSVFTLRRNRMDWLHNLQKFCELVSNTHQVEAKSFFYGLDHTVPPETGEEIRLITQELIANVLKHSGANRLTIQVNRNPGEINISVEDNGKGFNPEEVKKGDGLHNISQRVAKFNGTFNVDTNKGAGTTIFVTLPDLPASVA